MISSVITVKRSWRQRPPRLIGKDVLLDIRPDSASVHCFGYPGNSLIAQLFRAAPLLCCSLPILPADGGSPPVLKLMHPLHGAAGASPVTCWKTGLRLQAPHAFCSICPQFKAGRNEQRIFRSSANAQSTKMVKYLNNYVPNANVFTYIRRVILFCLKWRISPGLCLSSGSCMVLKGWLRCCFLPLAFDGNLLTQHRRSKQYPVSRQCAGRFSTGMINDVSLHVSKAVILPYSSWQ